MRIELTEDERLLLKRTVELRMQRLVDDLSVVPDRATKIHLKAEFDLLERLARTLEREFPAPESYG